MKDPIDQLAELVSDRYPKGTSDEFGKALRHQLHKLGRLNEPTSEFGFVVLVYSGSNEAKSGFDVFITDTWQEALAVRPEAKDRRVIRELVPPSAGNETARLWGHRVKDANGVRDHELSGESDFDR